MKQRSAELARLVRLACQETIFWKIRKITELLMQKILAEDEILTIGINLNLLARLAKRDTQNLN